MIHRSTQADEFLQEAEKNLGSSKNLIDSVQTLNSKYYTKQRGNISDSTLVEANKLATCTYEHNTQWGKQVIKSLSNHNVFFFN